MRARMEALDPVDRPGFFVVDLPRLGQHRFRLPSFSRGARINQLWTERKDVRDAMVFEVSGALIGAAWRHDLLELETPFPAEVTTASLVQFSEAVQAELEEHGYRPTEILQLGTALAARMRARAIEEADVETHAGFSGPAKGVTSSPASSSDSSSRGTPTPSKRGTRRRE